MPDLKSRAEWQIMVSDTDFQLILKALGARLTTDEAPAALALGDRLTDIKASILIGLGVNGEVLRAALENKGYEPPTRDKHGKRKAMIDPAKAGETATIRLRTLDE